MKVSEHTVAVSVAVAVAEAEAIAVAWRVLDAVGVEVREPEGEAVTDATTVLVGTLVAVDAG